MSKANHNANHASAVFKRLAVKFMLMRPNSFPILLQLFPTDKHRTPMDIHRMSIAFHCMCMVKLRMSTIIQQMFMDIHRMYVVFRCRCMVELRMPTVLRQTPIGKHQ